jgi:hypothetical protein
MARIKSTQKKIGCCFANSGLSWYLEAQCVPRQTLWLSELLTSAANFQGLMVTMVTIRRGRADIVWARGPRGVIRAPHATTNTDQSIKAEVPHPERGGHPSRTAAATSQTMRMRFSNEPP